MFVVFADWKLGAEMAVPNLSICGRSIQILMTKLYRQSKLRWFSIMGSDDVVKWCFSPVLTRQSLCLQHQISSTHNTTRSSQIPVMKETTNLHPIRILRSMSGKPASAVVHSDLSVPTEWDDEEVVHVSRQEEDTNGTTAIDRSLCSLLLLASSRARQASSSPFVGVGG